MNNLCDDYVELFKELQGYKRAYELLMLKVSAEDRLFVEKFRKEEHTASELSKFLEIDDIMRDNKDEE